MKNIRELIKIEPYKYSYKYKQTFFLSLINKLIFFHIKKSKNYKKILKHLGYKKNKYISLELIPYIPVRLFKTIDLISINKNQIYRILKSSGTTNKEQSKVYLDKINSKIQIDTLTKLTNNIIGNKRLPMLIIDKESNKNELSSFTARIAAIRGFSIFASDKLFALDNSMKLKLNKVIDFLKKYNNKKIIIFGFTSIIWEHFLNNLNKRKIKLKLNNAIIIHGGGWKKLENKKIDNNLFKNKINNLLGTNKVINYYGMVEQTGSIFYECKQGFFHTSNFNDILIRNINLQICKYNEKGLIQLISLLPTSYPGHSILTEDLGSIYGLDDCKCGRKGKYFRVFGRIKNAELRGCSDVV